MITLGVDSGKGLLTNCLLKQQQQQQQATKSIDTFKYGDIAVGGSPRKEEPFLGEIHLFSLLTDICVFMGERENKKMDISSGWLKLTYIFSKSHPLSRLQYSRQQRNQKLTLRKRMI